MLTLCFGISNSLVIFLSFLFVFWLLFLFFLGFFWRFDSVIYYALIVTNKRYTISKQRDKGGVIILFEREMVENEALICIDHKSLECILNI